MSDKQNKFHSLTPVRDADIGIYSEALDYVFADEDLRNVAISGAYSAGKSSILESYKAKHKDKNFIHISLAHFEEASKDNASSTIPQEDGRQDTVKESVLEGKILNQLMHQIPPSKIPQTNFRIKREIIPKMVTLWTVATVAFVLSLLHLIFFRSWQTYVESIYTTWIKNILTLSTKNSSLLLTGILCTVLGAFLLNHMFKIQLNKGIFKKISTDKFEIEIFEGSEDSYFDKYLNEVIYLFDQCEADVIVFEDMDRYNANRIFERLREINNLINAKRKKEHRKKKNGEKSLRFLYLLRDDIFVLKDRTKFFDFIIPIVPVIDGSNSYEQFIKHLTDSGIWGLFDESFLQELSLYIDDMRILKNICNEFLIYNSRLNITELNPDKLMAMITYKNLFPRDFSNLQLGQGFVDSLFSKKDELIASKIAQLEEKLDTAKKRIDAANKEHLISSQELNLVMQQKIDSIYNEYDRNKKNKLLQEIELKKKQRLQSIQDKNNEQLLVLENDIQQFATEITRASSATLKEIITRDNIKEVFSVKHENELGDMDDFRTVRGNVYFPLLKYLIRNGYIDETYADYITYFYEGSLTRTDKIFLRSISDQVKKEPSYHLQEPQKILARLKVAVFSQPEVLNYDLLFYLLKTCASDIHNKYLNDIFNKINKNINSNHVFYFDVEKLFPDFTLSSMSNAVECLMSMVEQILSEKGYIFLQRIYFDTSDDRLNYLVNLLNYERKDCLVSVLQNKGEVSNTLQEDFVIRTLMVTPEREILNDNDFKNVLSLFISDHPTLLNKERFEESNIKTIMGEKIFLLWEFLKIHLIHEKFISKLKNLGVHFRSIDYNKAHPDLFELIYKNCLYELNFTNISHLLSVKYELTLDDTFKHKNYTLIKTQPDSPLAAYVDDTMDDYMDVVLTNCENLIVDDEDIILSVLNNEKISSNHKEKYIQALQTKIQTITDVSDKKLWGQLLTANLVAHTAQNVLDYFIESDHQITNELVTFLDSDEQNYNFSMVQKHYNEDTLKTFFNTTVQCNELSDYHYEQLITSQNRCYDTTNFDIDDIAKEKVDILINHLIICMDEPSLLFLRASYPENLLHFITVNIDTYCDLVVEPDIFDEKESIMLLAEEIEDRYKLKLLRYINEAISANHAEYSDDIKSYILDNNYNVNDLQHFMLQFSSEGRKTKDMIVSKTLEWLRTNFTEPLRISSELFDQICLMNKEVTMEEKTKLFSCLLPSLDEAECRLHLKKLGSDQFLHLFDKKQSLLPKNDTNEQILKVFIENGWIIDYEVDEEDNNYYKVLGRKKH